MDKFNLTLLEEEKEDKFNLTLLEKPKQPNIEQPFEQEFEQPNLIKEQIQETKPKSEQPEFNLTVLPKLDIYLEPYTLQPKQIGDMARIMGTTVEPPKEPVMGLEYIPAKVYSYLVEEPLAHAGALVSQGLASGFRALG